VRCDGTISQHYSRKRVLLSALANLLTVVTSINATTGAFATSGLLATSGNTLQVVPVTKTDQQTPTSNALAVTPLHQQDHDSAAKAWVFFNGSGTIQSSYNVSSVSQGSAGNYLVNFTTPFASTTSFGANVTPVGGGAPVGIVAAINSASQIQVFTLGTSFTGADPSVGTMVTCYGRQ
jgi:hypothetical protein